MRIIGITGGVGTGKSKVLSYMENQFNAVICQADHVAWELQKPGQECYNQIIIEFGKEILNEDETINRGILANIVFSDEIALEKLNRIMHPAVKTHILQWIEIEQAKGTNFFVIEAALLLETNYDEICDEIWYIYSDEKTRRTRLKENRNYTDEKIDSIMKNQLSDLTFQNRCDIIIDNNGEFNETCCQIDKVMNN